MAEGGDDAGSELLMPNDRSGSEGAGQRIAVFDVVVLDPPIIVAVLPVVVPAVAEIVPRAVRFRDLVKKLTLDRRLAHAAHGADPGTGHQKASFGSGHADETESAFLLEFRVALASPRMRKKPVFQPDHRHRVELKAFRGMQRHQGHEEAW